MKKENHHLVQLNIAKMKGENIEDPIMQGFVLKLDEVNALAEQSEGFVWRLKDEINDATSYNPFGDTQIIVNFSMWEDAESLKNFVFKSMHVEVMKRKKEWFERFGKPYLVMWHISEGEIPTLEEAKKRLEHLQENGDSDYAFGFRYLSKG